MSPYSQGSDLTWLRIGLPFCRGETMMEAGPVRLGRAWGLGCWTPPDPGLEVLADGFGLEPRSRAVVGLGPVVDGVALVDLVADPVGREG